MKKIGFILLNLILCIALILPVCAEMTEGVGIIIEQLEGWREEADKVIATVEADFEKWEKYVGKDKTGMTYSLMYKVYYLNNGGYTGQGSFADCISESYFWNVPCYDKGSELRVIQSSSSETGWVVHSGSTYQKDINFNYPNVIFGIEHMYDHALSQYPDLDRDSLKVIYSDSDGMYLLYFTDDNEEYLVPYFDSKDITWVTNRAVYKAKTFADFKSKAADESGTVQLPVANTTQTIYVIYVTAGSVAVICAAAVAIYIAKKNKVKKNKTE